MKEKKIQELIVNTSNLPTCPTGRIETICSFINIALKHKTTIPEIIKALSTRGCDYGDDATDTPSCNEALIEMLQEITPNE